ncbi:MAG: MarR family transcriptional regulator [Planctomycetaceae bacterium]|nr:MarR family transcriptional regulator [Planctomycetaceae bacterium]
MIALSRAFCRRPPPLPSQIAAPVLQFDFEKSPGSWISLTYQTIRRALDSELKHQDITFRQWEVLAWLAMCGDLSPGMLADRLNVEAPTLTGIINRMERDGWLEKTSREDDLRCKKLHPTEKAEAIWLSSLECCLRVRSRATAGFSEEELALLKSFCERIRTNLGDGGCRPCEEK